MKKKAASEEGALSEDARISEELERLERERAALEGERKADRERMEEERKRFEEERRRLESEISSLRREVKKEQAVDSRMEKELAHIEKDVAQEDRTDAKFAREIQTLREELDDTRMDVELLQRGMKEFEEWKGKLLKNISEIEEAARALGKELDLQKKDMQTLGGTTLKKVDARVQKLETDAKSIFEELDDLEEEVGYGESLNVGKLPPRVIENSYQIILDDIMKALHKSFGVHETEKIMLNTTEELRHRTTGSELFSVKGGRIELYDVVRTIEKGLISPKQIQMTYDELLKKLVEHVPHYRPKNLRAILRVKSLEYAVENIKKLLSEREGARKNQVQTYKKDNVPAKVEVPAPKVEDAPNVAGKGESIEEKEEETEYFDFKRDKDKESEKTKGGE